MVEVEKSGNKNNSDLLVLWVVEEQVQAIVDDLSLADRAYFAKDRQKVIKASIDSAIALLDTKPIDSSGKSSNVAPTFFR